MCQDLIKHHCMLQSGSIMKPAKNAVAKAQQMGALLIPWISLHLPKQLLLSKVVTRGERKPSHTLKPQGDTIHGMVSNILLT